MQDEKVIDKPVEEKKEILPEDKFVYKRDSKKSLRQLSSELNARARTPEVVEKKEEKPIIEEKKVEKAPEVTKELKEPKIDVEAIKREAREEAQRAAREEFERKTQEILDTNKSMEEKQKEADELISVFEKENRLPTDYKEVMAETLRVAEAKFKQLQRQQDEKKKADDLAKEKEEEDKKIQLQKTQEEKLNDITTRVKAELKELSDMNFIPKPPATYDPENEDQKKIDALIQFGIDLNTKRVKEGLPVVDSISKIYFMHYKPFIDASGKTPSKQPAGVDAPIAGAQTTTQKEPPTDRYVYKRDHNKSFRQILTEQYNRLRK